MSHGTGVWGTGAKGFAITKWGIYTRYEKGFKTHIQWTSFKALMDNANEIRHTTYGICAGDYPLGELALDVVGIFIKLFKDIAERRQQLDEDSDGEAESEHNILKTNGTW